MARYSNCYTVTISVAEFPAQFANIMKLCGCEIVYHTIEYMMASEIPGKVPYSKLITVEVLLDTTKATKTQMQVDLVVKNDELPLQSNNHCRKMFDKVTDAIASSPEWKLLEEVAS
jgi:hypothetical protein